MPWKESYRMNERMLFISKLMDGDRMTDVCREFGISRKTGYKFLERFRNEGPAGLEDKVPRALFYPNKTPDEIEHLVLKTRAVKPTWGPKKIRERLRLLYPGIKVPAASTVGEILKRNGYIESKKRKRKKNFYPTTLTKSTKPNEVWCTDFKGQFRLKNGKYCYPLTITDHYSRFIFSCEALESTKMAGAFPVFEAAFKEYGLPKTIRSDNGAPFASGGLAGLSKLSAWFIRLGIRPERIEPGHPEQNGRHERMHRTLKAETTRPPAANILQQQEYFDKFIHAFNSERPHEALNMKTPGSVYKTSTKQFKVELSEPDYSLHDHTRKVAPNGSIKLPLSGRPHCMITESLIGHTVGLREIEDEVWSINFCDLKLGFISKFDQNFKLTLENPLTPLEG